MHIAGNLEVPACVSCDGGHPLQHVRNHRLCSSLTVLGHSFMTTFKLCAHAGRGPVHTSGCWAREPTQRKAWRTRFASLSCCWRARHSDSLLLLQVCLQATQQGISDQGLLGNPRNSAPAGGKHYVSGNHVGLGEVVFYQPSWTTYWLLSHCHCGKPETL